MAVGGCAPIEVLAGVRYRRAQRMKEATARIKINKLLDGAGWCFFADGTQPANICLEPSVTIKVSDLDALGSAHRTGRFAVIGRTGAGGLNPLADHAVIGESASSA